MSAIVFLFILAFSNAFMFTYPGYYINEDDVVECESGYYCPGDDKKYECPDGFYSLKEREECWKCGCINSDTCPKGTKTDNKTGITIYAGQCEGESPCKPGYGYERKTRVCLKCWDGMYSPGGSNPCQDCKRNEMVSEGQDRCIECPAGEISVTGVDCRPCKRGTYFNNQTKDCEICQEGYYTDEERQFTCKKCPNGMYSNSEFSGCQDRPPFFEPNHYHLHYPKFKRERYIIDDSE